MQSPEAVVQQNKTSKLMLEGNLIQEEELKALTLVFWKQKI